MSTQSEQEVSAAFARFEEQCAPLRELAFHSARKALVQRWMDPVVSGINRPFLVVEARHPRLVALIKGGGDNDVLSRHVSSAEVRELENQARKLAGTPIIIRALVDPVGCLREDLQLKFELAAGWFER